MLKGDILILNIVSYAFEGKGIAKVDLDNKSTDGQNNFVVFVNSTYTGDKVEAMLTKIKKTYAEAKLLKIILPSNLRTESKCKYFGICGGCKQQDLDYQKQLEFKTQQVKEIAEHIGGFKDFNLSPIISSENTYGYRNKMEFSFSDKRWLTNSELTDPEKIEDKNFALGLHIPRIYDKVLDIDECLLQSDECNKILDFTKSFFKEKNISCYSSKTHTGFLRHLVLRQSYNNKDIMVNLVTYGEDKDLLEEFTKEITNKIILIKTVVNNINLKKAQIAVGDYEIVFYGDGYIYDKIGDKNFRISANSFFQTNTKQAENLYQAVIDLAGFSFNDVVYDLYAGAGTITTFIADKIKYAYGFESIESAIKDAVVNKELNGIRNIDFILADLNKSFLPLIRTNNLAKPNIIITDPPRSGMNPKTVNDILQLSPEKIIYVSCNPATQMRDIKMLTEFNYELKKMIPVDMFPHTFHIENVALLEKLIQ
ncbi:MAG: 23S rRNA (uracil(1939)-C(5))-methyltransferase RlmD [Ignavibacteriales bacterium]|nr:23S rRNA (uracil(1939)-C(5))-methyltransferase RlmD [Ignavibacteriales bacterium]